MNTDLMIMDEKYKKEAVTNVLQDMKPSTSSFFNVLESVDIL